jgi:DNA processing protein
MLESRPSVAIVGSRSISAYGRQVTYDLAYKLASQGIVIVSGLALGVDAVAHNAALAAGGLTIAVLPSPVEYIYPTTNYALGNRIIASGGAVVSEYGPSVESYKSNFVARNRIVAGLANALLITEAAASSGTLHTANFALGQNKTVLAVPGAITSAVSVGTNNLIKAGAVPVTCVEDVLQALNITPDPSTYKQVRGGNAREQSILDLLLDGTRDGDRLLEVSGLSVPEFNQSLTMLEISGKIRPLGGNQWCVF